MKHRSQRLQRVTDLAERRTDEAARTVGERRTELDQAQAQLGELERFRAEYARAGGGASVSVAELLNRQQFVQRIDQAIVQQRRDIERHQRRLAEAQSTWLQTRNRAAALDSVTRRYREQEQRAEDRMDQEAVDERMQHRKSGWRDG